MWEALNVVLGLGCSSSIGGWCIHSRNRSLDNECLVNIKYKVICSPLSTTSLLSLAFQIPPCSQSLSMSSLAQSLNSIPSASWLMTTSSTLQFDSCYFLYSCWLTCWVSPAFSISISDCQLFAFSIPQHSQLSPFPNSQCNVQLVPEKFPVSRPCCTQA